MKTTIDNNQRVLLITTSTNNQAFCNPQDFKEVLKQLGTNEGYYKVYHFWNGKQKIISKKDLSNLVE